MQVGVVGQRSARTKPHRLVRDVLAFHVKIDGAGNMAHIERPVGEHALAHGMQTDQVILEVGELVRVRDAARHRLRVFHARALILE